MAGVPKCTHGAGHILGIFSLYSAYSALRHFLNRGAILLEKVVTEKNKSEENDGENSGLLSLLTEDRLNGD